MSGPRFCRREDRKRIRRRGWPVNREYTGEMALVVVGLAVGILALAALFWIGVAGAEGQILYVSTAGGPLNARYGPSRGDHMMYQIPNGEPVQADGEPVRGWQPVRYAGDPVWCWAAYLSEEPPEEVAGAFAMTVEVD